MAITNLVQDKLLVLFAQLVITVLARILRSLSLNAIQTTPLPIQPVSQLLTIRLFHHKKQLLAVELLALLASLLELLVVQDVLMALTVHSQACT